MEMIWFSRWFILMFVHFLDPHVTGEYEVEVVLESYNNPTGLCDGCRSQGSPDPGCCEAFSTKRDCSARNTCDTFVEYCFRSLGITETCTNYTTTETSFNSNSLTFASEPAVILKDISPWRGIIFFFRALDDDTTSNTTDDLIDTFSIDITVPVGTSLPRTTYISSAGLAELTLNFSVRCTDDFYGQDCLTLCPNFQSCAGCGLSGFTGEFCQFSTSDCARINCNDNAQCVDGLSMCICNPGYTGTNCEVDIDECESVNCSGNGQCVDGQNSFVCVCREGFTGQLCESSIEPVVCSNSGGVIGGVVGGIVTLMVLAIPIVIVLLLVIKYCRGRKKTTIYGEVECSDMVMTPNQVYGVTMTRSEDKIEMNQNEVYGISREGQDGVLVEPYVLYGVNDESESDYI